VPLTLLQAYGKLSWARPAYSASYWAVAEQLKATEPDNVQVLEALADKAVQNKNAEALSAGIRYLQEANSYMGDEPHFEGTGATASPGKRAGGAANRPAAGECSRP